ncbi:hypothetical protein I302_104577 [Kwoniella bestiolae CBS 10118]|uniref:Uncharacterized protein n=1 Tax=Kwoniella bestiolae CBS 10118 TaxID=1296100 RepID=A0A1B9GBM2_9TREE|nr:hypothetical protein I302_03283 [Kwoniella bestiolae CBS 10118]OCF28424.1 hypothetical protein I302_03283 [Kwoniella bestiolae CBS 10118]
MTSPESKETKSKETILNSMNDPDMWTIYVQADDGSNSAFHVNRETGGVESKSGAENKHRRPADDLKFPWEKNPNPDFKLSIGRGGSEVIELREGSILTQDDVETICSMVRGSAHTDEQCQDAWAHKFNLRDWHFQSGAALGSAATGTLLMGGTMFLIWAFPLSASSTATAVAGVEVPGRTAADLTGGPSLCLTSSQTENVGSCWNNEI